MSCAVGDCNPDRTQRHGNIPSHAWYHTNSGLTMYCKTMVRYVIRDEKAPQCFTKRQKQGEFAISSPGQTAKTKTTKGAPLFSVPKWALLCKQQTKQPNKQHSTRKRIKQTIKQTRAAHNRHLPCRHSGNAHTRPCCSSHKALSLPHCTLYLPWYPPLSACPPVSFKYVFPRQCVSCPLSHRLPFRD